MDFTLFYSYLLTYLITFFLFFHCPTLITVFRSGSSSKVVVVGVEEWGRGRVLEGEVGETAGAAAGGAVG
jgi:hypothetical protein